MSVVTIDPSKLLAPSAPRRCTYVDADGRQCDGTGVFHVVVVLSSEPVYNLHQKVRMADHRRCLHPEHRPRDLGLIIRSEAAWAKLANAFALNAQAARGARVAPVWDLSSVEYTETDEEIDRLEVEWFHRDRPKGERFEGGHGKVPVRRVHVRPAELPDRPVLVPEGSDPSGGQSSA
jgi:hypothetical protein